MELNDFNVKRKEDMMGTSLLIPHSSNNSGVRLQMAYNQITQIVNPVECDIPYISTGYENHFNEKGSSFIRAEKDYDVIAILHKYLDNPKIHYYLLVKESDSDVYDIIEHKSAIHTSEMYGYTTNSDYLNNVKVGSRSIRKGDVIKKSNVVDKYNNRGGGRNLLTAYIENSDNEEDAIIISESCAKKLTVNLVHEIDIIINENDTPLNIYGDKDFYKIMPDTGENIKDGILMATRRIINNEILFSQSSDRLRSLQVPDDKYFANGKVVDIDVLCNNPALLDTKYYSQLKKYYEYSTIFSKSVVDAVDNLVKTNPNYKMKYDLDKLYHESKGIINRVPILYNNKKFSNMLVKILVVEEHKCTSGDKLSDRYGGKGEIGKVVPDELMPHTEDGTVIDIVTNPKSTIKRENLGTIIEPTINMASSIVLKYILNALDNEFLTEDRIDDLLDFVYNYLFIVAPDEAENFNDYVFGYIPDTYSKVQYLKSMVENECLHISVSPNEVMNMETLRELKYFLPEIEDMYIEYKIKDSKGNLKTIKSRRPVTVGYKYFYIMKQIGKIKHSAVSLSSVGITSNNVKSRNKKLYKSAIKGTPIRFGEMELMNLIHFSKNIYKMMTIYSSSPQGRRSLKDILLTDNIFDINLDIKSGFRNRNFEILNAYLTTMGIKIVTIKKENYYKQIPLLRNIWALKDEDDDSEAFFRTKTYSDFKHDNVSVNISNNGVPYFVDYDDNVNNWFKNIDKVVSNNGVVYLVDFNDNINDWFKEE